MHRVSPISTFAKNTARDSRLISLLWKTHFSRGNQISNSVLCTYKIVNTRQFATQGDLIGQAENAIDRMLDSPGGSPFDPESDNGFVKNLS